MFLYILPIELPIGLPIEFHHPPPKKKQKEKKEEERKRKSRKYERDHGMHTPTHTHQGQEDKRHERSRTQSRCVDIVVASCLGEREGKSK